MITAAILAGGQSRRMGTDKAALKLEGLPLLERTARTALGAELPVLVAGRARPNGWPLETVGFAEDDQPGLGPLGGLATALRSTSAPVLVLACDLPLLTADAVRWLQAQPERWNTQNGNTQNGNTHGLIVVNGEQWEPLFSIYRPECLPLVEARLAAGRRSLHGLIEAGNFVFTDAPDWVAAQLVNVNTAEEWQALQENIKR